MRCDAHFCVIQGACGHLAGVQVEAHDTCTTQCHTGEGQGVRHPTPRHNAGMHCWRPCLQALVRTARAIGASVHNLAALGGREALRALGRVALDAALPAPLRPGKANNNDADADSRDAMLKVRVCDRQAGPGCSRRGLLPPHAMWAMRGVHASHSQAEGRLQGPASGLP